MPVFISSFKQLLYILYKIVFGQPILTHEMSFYWKYSSPNFKIKIINENNEKNE